MKKLTAILLFVILALLFSITVQAGPALVAIEYSDLSEFTDLCDMAKNASDEELDEFLNKVKSPYYYSGINNREDVNEFIASVGHAVIPVLNDPVKWVISIPRGTTETQDDQGYLLVYHWFPGETIQFYSFYNHDKEKELASLKSRHPGAFDKPTAEINGAKIYQLTDSNLHDFIIIFDDYMLWATIFVNKTPEEKLNEIMKFSYVRLDGGEDTPPDNTVLLIWIASGAVLAACAGGIIWKIKKNPAKHRVFTIHY